MQKFYNDNDNLAKIAMNKSLLKEFHNSENDRIVYLKDGDEFQIQIFNPYSYVIGVSFTFNSNNNDNSKLLVLRPGERVWLDRYLNENKKLKFSTYKVNNSNDTRKAIEQNGIINIHFYKEKEINNNIYIYNTYTAKTWEPEKTWDPNKIWYTNYETTCDNNITAVNSVLNSVVGDISYTNFCSALDGCADSNLNTTATYTSASYSSASTHTKCGTNSCINQNNANRSLNKKSIETGRIDKGSYSNQNFNNYYGDFDSWYFKKETIKILPESQKQISTNDLNKKYCHNCGRKIKKEFKYCPNCGAEQ